MACGVRETVTVTRWGVCWKWIFPYPCKKTTQETRYQYDFRPWRTRFSWSPFRRSGNGPWVDTLWTYLSDEVIGSSGNCPFNEGGVIL
jgi:hypothetical protein